jgi:hypothetical protein
MQMFARKYATAARQYSDAVFLEIFGDESKATRQLMIDMKVSARAQPACALKFV